MRETPGIPPCVAVSVRRRWGPALVSGLIGGAAADPMPPSLSLLRVAPLKNLGGRTVVRMMSPVSATSS